MTEGAIWKNILLFALPLMLGNIFQQLYNTVDSIVVGNFVGKEALAAVGTTDSIINTFIGFFSGLIIDIQFGNILGFYALIYLLIGYVNGLFEQMYFDEDIKLPLILISASEFVYGLVIYLLMFLLRSEFDFLHYLSHIIIPELIYTIAVTLPLYPVILFINHKLDAEEKRSASKFV